MDVHEVLSAAAYDCTETESVLATIVSVEGHAYRKRGAMMLLREGGEAVGSISPGCLEADLQEHVPEIVRAGRHRLVRYDTRSDDDMLWGTSVGCGGLIHVLLEPVRGALRRCLLDIQRMLEIGEAACLVRELPAEADGPGNISYQVRRAAEQERPASAPAAFGPGVMPFVCSFVPKPRLIVFGANHDARPLAMLAQHTGFRVVAADWREGLCTRMRFPGAELAVGSPRELVQSLNLTERDFVVVMSHHMQLDREMIEYLMSCRLQYVGIMGSSARIRRLLEGLRPPSWFRYPVGLRIGAVGPEEIAVSIVAEMIAVKRGGDRGQSMNGVEADGHKDSRHLSGCRSGNADGRSEAFP